MATPVMDVGVLQHFSPFFLFFLVWIMMFAFFQWAKLFGDIKILHAFMALTIAFFATLFDAPISAMIQYVIPRFVFLLIFAVLIIMVLKVFGTTDDNLHDVVKEPGVYWTILIIAIVILMGGLSKAWGQSSLEFTGSNGYSGAETPNEVALPNGAPGAATGSTNTGDFNQNLGATFYNPKILGTIFLLLMAAIGTRMLSTPATK